MPVIPGKDFDRLLKSMKENENKKVSPEEFQKGKEAHKLFGFDKL